MKRIFIIGLLFLYAFTLYSQSNIRYYFKTLDIQDGLSQNTVNAILQDKQGFMWFGTKDGLNRFDGLSFRIFKKENSALGIILSLHFMRIKKEIFGLEQMQAFMCIILY